MADPTISVVIPCFNAARFLKETVDSALAQSTVSAEVIVVDDGSTDETREVIRLLGTSVRAIFGPNRGASAARNRGTRESRGAFIQYLDADDLLAADTLEKRLDALKRSGADVAYCDWERYEEDQNGSFRPAGVTARRIEEVDQDAALAWLTEFWAPPASLLYRKALVTQIGGWNESLLIIQDARFALDAAVAGAKFVHVPGVGAKYRVTRAPSLSRREPALFALECLTSASEIHDQWLKAGTLNGARLEALAKVYDYAARELFASDQQGFKRCIDRLYSVRPGFELTWPKTADRISRVFGFAGAAAFMPALTKLKKRIRGRATFGAK